MGWPKTTINLQIIICAVSLLSVAVDAAVSDIKGTTLDTAKSLRVKISADTCNSGVNCLPPVSPFDRSHRYVTNRFDGVARWLDNFFGDVEQERESASSLVRLHYDNVFSEGGFHNDRIRVRGKVRLPQLSRKLNLIFSDEDDESSPTASSKKLFSDENSQAIALQLDVRRESDFKLDHRIGLKSGDQIKVASRARYRWIFAEFWRGSISEEVFWQDTIGFGSKTITDIDYVHDPDRLTRWRNQFNYNEESRGVEWGSTLSYSRALDDEKAVSYYLRAFGVTQPKYLTQGYGPGIVYRQNVLKRWLFWELEPRYTWGRSELQYHRNGVASIVFRIEVAFSEKHKQ